MNRDFILGEEKPSSAVLKLSSPTAISTVSTVIYNIIDTIFIGRYVFTLGIAAVSIYLPIQMMIMSITQLFTSGVGSYISRELGKKNKKNAEKATGSLIAFIFTLSILLCAFGLIFAKPIVEAFGAQGAVIPYASSYAKAMFIGILFYPLCIASNNIMRAEGASKHSMVGTIISIVSNIFLDFLFIVIFRWGVFGAGLATTISKFINLMYLIYAFKFKTYLKVKVKYIRYDFKIIKKGLPIGFSTFLNQFVGSISIMLLNRDLYALGGNYVIAVYGIVYKLTSLIQRSVGGFSRGTQPLIGYNFGAKNISRIKACVKFSLLFSFIIATIGTILLMIFSNAFTSMFTTNHKLIAYSSHILIIALLSSPLLGVYFLSISFFRAIGYAKESIILSLFRRVIFFIPLLYILPYAFKMGIIGIWITLPLSNFLSAIFASFFLFKTLKKLDKIEELKKVA
ncbi:MATE family efflux transporter [uncultured Clostridium sp.]|uniref:MATE family efflux transporter n=1 Tax=uncultured Clostridium sp. TaxID=59620 RepID=UPI0026228A9E|nr:MATE family efflux transporter [uncultured Clostridium sp.]